MHHVFLKRREACARLARRNNATVDPLVKTLLEPRFVAHGLD